MKKFCFYKKETMEFLIIQNNKNKIYETSQHFCKPLPPLAICYLISVNVFKDTCVKKCNFQNCIFIRRSLFISGQPLRFIAFYHALLGGPNRWVFWQRVYNERITPILWFSLCYKQSSIWRAGTCWSLHW